jgi:hypothetical protein
LVERGIDGLRCEEKRGQLLLIEKPTARTLEGYRMSVDNNNLLQAPWEQVSEHLGKRVELFHSLLGILQSGFDRNDRNLALFNIGYRAAQEVGRTSHWLHESNDLVAWCVRNLYELDLILNKILSSTEALNNWLGQFAKDEIDIIEGFQTIRDISSERVNEHFGQLSAKIKKFSQSSGFEMSGPWITAKLAKSIGREGEYRLFYKFLSKYVHPSSWSINANQARINSDDYRNILVGLVQILERRLYDRLEKEFDLAGRVSPTEQRCSPWRASSYDGIPIETLRQTYSALQSILNAHIDRWKNLPVESLTPEDIAALEQFAMSDYLVQRFDWPTWPRWELQSAKLCGAINRFREALNTPRESILDETNDALTDKLRSDLGPEMFESEYLTGQALTWNEAVRLALSVPAICSNPTQPK